MQFVTSCISTTMVLVLLGLTVFFVLSAQSLSAYVRENLNFTVLVRENVSESDILKFQQELNKYPFVKSSLYISKEQALKEQTEAMGSDPAEFIGYNPFSPIIEVKLLSAYANTDSIAWVKSLIEQNKIVGEVDYQEALIQSVNTNLHKISLGLLALAGLLTLVSFALINNTIRLTIYSKRFLIHTMKLVGASWGFIRRPFLVRNFWIGIISGLLAGVVLLGGAYALVRHEPDLLAVITTGILLRVVASVLVFGVIITWLCAYFSINKYLRMRADTLYYT